jgi:hypothetical protein
VLGQRLLHRPCPIARTARQSSCDIPPRIMSPEALLFGVGWDHGGGPCKTSRRSQSVRTRHLLLTPARSGSAARARASVLCVAPSAKSRAYAARSSSKGAPSSSDVGGGAPFAAARPQRGGALHPYASRLQEQLANVRVIGPLSGLDATLRAILEQFNRCWHRRLDPSDRRPQQCLTSRYEIGDHVGLAQGRHGTRARLAPLAKRSPSAPCLWTDEPR